MKVWNEIKISKIMMKSYLAGCWHNMHGGVSEIEIYRGLSLSATVSCKCDHFGLIDRGAMASLWVALIGIQLLRALRHFLDKGGDSITVGAPQIIIPFYNG